MPQQPAQPAPSHFNRNLLAGIALLVLLIVLLSVMRGCNSRNDRLRPAVTDSTATAAVTDANHDPMSIFIAELRRNNFDSDNAVASAAVRIPGQVRNTPTASWA